MKCKKCKEELDEETEIKSIEEKCVRGGVMVVGYECCKCGFREDL